MLRAAGAAGVPAPWSSACERRRLRKRAMKSAAPTPLSQTSPDDERHAPVLQGERVVEIARDLARRMEGRGDLPAGRLRQRVGQEVFLDLPPDLEVSLELAGMEAVGVLEPFLLERRGHARAQHHGVERLGKVVGGAELDRAGDAFDLVDRGDHDDRDRPERRVLAHPLQHLEAVHLRHHDVEEHEVDLARAEDFEGLAAVDGHRDLVAEGAQAPRQQVAVDLHVVDDEQAAGRGRHALRGARSWRR